MQPGRYAVECDLGLDRFDDLADGVAMARSVHREVRRLRGAHSAIRSTRIRRRARTVVEISVTLTAESTTEAFDLGASAIRSAIHAAGGNTAGWEGLRPRVAGTPTRRRRRRRGSTLREPVVFEFPSWAEISRDAQRRSAAAPVLPPLQGLSAPAVVDLRR